MPVFLVAAIGDYLDMDRWENLGASLFWTKNSVKLVKIRQQFAYCVGKLHVEICAGNGAPTLQYNTVSRQYSDCANVVQEWAPCPKRPWRWWPC